MAGEGDGEPVPPGKLRVTVTHLEMGAPPAGGPLPPPEDGLEIVSLDPVTVSNYRFLYNTVGEAWLWGERRAMDDEKLAAVLDRPGLEVKVLRSGGEDAGFYELVPDDDSGIQLAYFGILPGFIGRGFGPYLLSCFLADAWSRRPRRVWVHTCTLDHPAALAMYKRAGFIPYRRSTDLEDDPRVLGLIPMHIAPQHPVVG